MSHKIFKFKYPKLTLLLICIFLAYYFFSNAEVREKIEAYGDLNYLGIFIAGLLFSFGFSTPFAVGFFVTAHPQNIFLAALIGGFGALLSDLFIYKIIKFSFMGEFHVLGHMKTAKKVKKFLKKHIPFRMGNYLLYVFSGIIIASPLPDELGVSLLAGLSHIKLPQLALISFIMNTLGIFIMLLL